MAEEAKHIGAIDSALLRTCRTIYRETIVILYAFNSFEFDRLVDLQHFAHAGLENKPFGFYCVANRSLSLTTVLPTAGSPLFTDSFWELALNLDSIAWVRQDSPRDVIFSIPWGATPIGRFSCLKGIGSGLRGMEAQRWEWFQTQGRSTVSLSLYEAMSLHVTPFSVYQSIALESRPTSQLSHTSSESLASKLSTMLRVYKFRSTAGADRIFR